MNSTPEHPAIVLAPGLCRSFPIPTAELSACLTLTLAGNCSKSRQKGYLEGQEKVSSNVQQTMSLQGDLSGTMGSVILGDSECNDFPILRRGMPLCNPGDSRKIQVQRDTGWLRST